ncbi:MAG: DUF308 domain-containing protein [Clostridia bacterium]|nr:DUF308 domain-containing protein [Clostridia bacterium]
MKIIKNSFPTILLSLFEAAVGILLLLDPIGFTKGIITAAGILLLLLGILRTVRYFRTDAKEAAGGQMLFTALILFLTGGFCTAYADWLIEIFPILTVLYGMVILLTGLMKVQWTVDMLRLKKKSWFLTGIGALVSILFAILILVNPFTTTGVLWMFTGIALIVESVSDIGLMIFAAVRMNEEV